MDKLLPKSPPIDFSRLGLDFFRCYFGDKPDATITDLAKILGVRGGRKWAEKFRLMIEIANMPFVKRKGRLRITPDTLAAWFELESDRRR